MRALLLGVLGTAAVAASVATAVNPWAAPPPLVYETVSGYPMRVYYRNVGEGHVTVIAAAGVPALSIDAPLRQEQIDSYLAEIRRQMKPSVTPSIVKAGDYVRFDVDDPDELAWLPGKTEHTTYFYVFAAVEMPRDSLVIGKWISELCLVAKTGEAFQRCPTHNSMTAGS